MISTVLFGLQWRGCISEFGLFTHCEYFRVNRPLVKHYLEKFQVYIVLFRVLLLALMSFLFGFLCRRDMIGKAGSHMVVVKESCSVVWTDSLQSCCSTTRCLYFFYFWRLTSAEGKKRATDHRPHLDAGYEVFWVLPTTLRTWQWWQ